MSEKQDKPPNTAVALHYDGRNAPRVTAKGSGDVADEIIDIARQHGVPLYENAALVGLLATIELESEIPEPLYVAVAEVIAFAYMLNGKTPDDCMDAGGRATHGAVADDIA